MRFLTSAGASINMDTLFSIELENHAIFGYHYAGSEKRCVFLVTTLFIDSIAQEYSIDPSDLAERALERLHETYANPYHPPERELQYTASGLVRASARELQEELVKRK